MPEQRCGVSCNEMGPGKSKTAPQRAHRLHISCVVYNLPNAGWLLALLLEMSAANCGKAAPTFHSTRPRRGYCPFSYSDYCDGQSTTES